MRTRIVGRLVIETNKETGLDEVELTLDNGQVLRFKGHGSSELRHVRPEPEMVDVGTNGVHEYVNGLREPDYWHFSLTVDRIKEVEQCSSES